MKLLESTIDVKSNITYDESVPVGIDESAISMVIERLISAYSNPYRAALQEYTSNAYDEHVASGQTRAVEVSLPNDLSPVLRIQDFGRGLTRSELKGFGTIGMSTKRDSNELTGGFGMGSKCALAAASQFTVTSVKNGVRNTVVIARDENNVPHMNFLAEAETSDPSGTTVVVPISDVHKFGPLTDFFVGWKRGSILVDGTEPTRSVYDPEDFQVSSDGYAYSDKLNSSSGRDVIRILINQVLYNLEYRDLGLSYTQWLMFRYYIIRIDNGSVDIAPSREDLLYNARTKAALQDRFDQVLLGHSKELRESARVAPTLLAAMKIRADMSSNGLPVQDLRWGKQALILPGDTVSGNRVPLHEGAWVIPHGDSSTLSGFRCERSWASIAQYEPWRGGSAYAARLVIVHSTGPHSFYGARGNRKTFRETSLTSDYLQSVEATSAENWRFFFTNQPLNRINRIFRDLAHSTMSAEAFEKAVQIFRQNKKSSASGRAKAVPVASGSLKILKGSSYHGPNIGQVTYSNLSNYSYVLNLRNRIGGLDEYVRSSASTQRNHSSKVADVLFKMASAYDVAIVLSNKGEDLSGLQSILPPLITFEELALMDLKARTVKASKKDRELVRDRNTFNIPVLSRLSGAQIKAIEDPETRAWISGFTSPKKINSNAGLYRDLSWISSWSTSFSKKLDKINPNNEKVDGLAESRALRYPLIFDMYTVDKISSVVDYINLVDASMSCSCKN